MRKKSPKTQEHEAAELAFSLVEEHFVDIEDYRRTASTSHRLSHIIFITLCGAIAGANSLKGVAEYAKDMEEWFVSILGLQHGVPSFVHIVSILIKNVPYKRGKMYNFSF